jgi:hypothetical protein
VAEVIDCTAGTGIDYRVTTVDAEHLAVDLKTKVQRTSSSLARLWLGVPAGNLFVLDEVYLRTAACDQDPVVTVVFDVGRDRWHLLSVPTLILCPKVRYRRFEQKNASFWKGKLLIDLANADWTGPAFDGRALRALASLVRRGVKMVDAWPVGGVDLPQVGGAPAA